MGPLTAATPKPLLPLRGRPIIEHILLGLRAAGVREAIVVTGYRGEQIEAQLGSGARLGMQLTYRRQATPEGTARALLLTQELIGNRPVVLSWGDIVVEPDQYAALTADFQRLPCAALLAINEVADPWQGAAVYVDADFRVTQLIEKPPRGVSHTRWNNAGLFVFTSLVFRYAERLTPSPRGEYELPQAVGAMVADGALVRARPLRGFWSDLGTPADLELAERTYLQQGSRTLPAVDGSEVSYD
jgi:dTDP-glucose pyrophosphorylase